MNLVLINQASRVSLLLHTQGLSDPIVLLCSSFATTTMSRGADQELQLHKAVPGSHLDQLPVQAIHLGADVLCLNLTQLLVNMYILMRSQLYVVISDKVSPAR